MKKDQGTKVKGIGPLKFECEDIKNKNGKIVTGVVLQDITGWKVV